MSTSASTPTKQPPKINTQHWSANHGSVMNPYYPVQTSLKSPICAVFLAHFNVHTGYELQWSRAIDGVSLKGIEYKALPSGLHAVERDVISFVHGDDDDSLLYGVSVYHQNLTQSISEDRETVKMYSLGVLVDPSKPRSVVNWKPSTYSCGLEYIEQLDTLLSQWDESQGFAVFERFFEEHSNDLNTLQSPRTPKTPTKKKPTPHHHYLLKLDKLLETLGPLIFRVWRSCLLRERVLLFDAESVELSCAFAYCLSIISTIPHEIYEEDTDKKSLHYIQPLYSLGVNDIDWLSKKSSGGFIGCSTDEILMFKTKLYDVAVRLDRPEVLPAEASVPGVTNVPALKATQRDLKRFKILAREFDLQKGDAKGETTPAWWIECAEPVSWRQMAWSGMYWWASAGEKEKMEEEQDNEGLSELADVNSDDVERALFIVGYFQSITRRMFRSLMEVIADTDDDEVATVEFADITEMGLDPYSKEDSEFLVKFVKVWWSRDVKIGGTLSNLCCL